MKCGTWQHQSELFDDFRNNSTQFLLKKKFMKIINGQGLFHEILYAYASVATVWALLFEAVYRWKIFEINANIISMILGAVMITVGPASIRSYFKQSLHNYCRANNITLYEVPDAVKPAYAMRFDQWRRKAFRKLLMVFLSPFFALVAYNMLIHGIH